MRESDDVSEEISLILDTSSLAGDTERLTWEASNDAVNTSCKFGDFERSNVGPDWSVVEQLVFDPRLEDALRLLVGFAVQDGSETVFVGCEGVLNGTVEHSCS